MPLNTSDCCLALSANVNCIDMFTYRNVMFSTLAFVTQVHGSNFGSVQQASVRLSVTLSYCSFFGRCCCKRVCSCVILFQPVMAPCICYICCSCCDTRVMSSLDHQSSNRTASHVLFTRVMSLDQQSSSRTASHVLLLLLSHMSHVVTRPADLRVTFSCCRCHTRVMSSLDHQSSSRPASYVLFTRVMSLDQQSSSRPASHVLL